LTDERGAEELPQPESRSRRVRRLRRDLALGAAVLLVILLVAKNHGDSRTGGRTSTSASAPTASTSMTAIPRALDERLPGHRVPNRNPRTVALCPKGFDCPVSHHITAGARAALEAAFPGARVVYARTVRAFVVNFGQAIWAADVRARIGDELLRLRLQPVSRTDHARHGTTLFGGHAITHWESLLSHLLVVIDVVAPADRPASLTAIDRLAHDTRLTSPW
jgi:hypothetical protein